MTIQLPADHEPDTIYTQLGFTLGEQDGPYQQATLPPGWHHQPTNHPTGSHIIDQHGRRRVNIFNKNTPHDRCAIMRLETVTGYATAVIDGATAGPVHDDQWCTPQAWAEALRGIRARVQADVDLWGRYDDDVARGQLGLARERLTRIDHLLAATTTDAKEGGEPTGG